MNTGLKEEDLLMVIELMCISSFRKNIVMSPLTESRVDPYKNPNLTALIKLTAIKTQNKANN